MYNNIQDKEFCENFAVAWSSHIVVDTLSNDDERENTINLEEESMVQPTDPTPASPIVTKRRGRPSKTELSTGTSVQHHILSPQAKAQRTWEIGRGSGMICLNNDGVIKELRRSQRKHRSD